MTTHKWDHEESKARIDKEIADLSKVEIVEYVKNTSLENIPKNKAYRMDAVHLYANIINLAEILENTDVEETTCHKRTLRFLNQHYRAVDRILTACEAVQVDFNGPRLHAVVAKPYNTEDAAEKTRIQRSVAIAQLIIDVLHETGDDDEQIPNAKVAVGIDSGKALAVNNGRRGGREPLFLGRPANHAAKHSRSSTPGIYLTAEARAALGISVVDNSRTTPLTAEQVRACQEAARLEVTKDDIVSDWREDMKKNPIGTFEFSGHTPPMRTLDFEVLTPGNSRRQDLISIYADIDGFTNFVSNNIESDPQNVVRVLHVIRSELDAALSSDFEGRRVRFIGDCIHGLICEGTAQTTDEHATASEAVLCAGALRSGFDLALERLEQNGHSTDQLGLAIGFEYGPAAMTRLGIQGRRVRTVIGRSVLCAEDEQARCNGVQTAIGSKAHAVAPASVKAVFANSRRADNLDYAEAVARLAEAGDKTAKAARATKYKDAAPGVVAYMNEPVRPHCE